MKAAMMILVAAIGLSAIGEEYELQDGRHPVNGRAVVPRSPLALAWEPIEGSVACRLRGMVSEYKLTERNRQTSINQLINQLIDKRGAVNDT